MEAEPLHIVKIEVASGIEVGKTVQKKSGLCLEDKRERLVVQMKEREGISDSETLVQKKENNTGLPDNLKSGIENLSGHSMDDVKVHYNSHKPAQLNAHAYAQGTEIHIASGQEKHLPHEAWHVVQQKEERVKPTKQLKSKVNINDDVSLEKEANVMGAKASQCKFDEKVSVQRIQKANETVVQRNALWNAVGKVTGFAGAIGGGFTGAVKGSIEGYHSGNISAGIRGGVAKGVKEGYKNPWAATVGAVIGGAGAIVGSFAGHALGTAGAIGGSVVGATLGFAKNGVDGALIGGAAGALIGYTVPVLAGAAVGAASGSALGSLIGGSGGKTKIKHTAGYITLHDFEGVPASNHEVGKKMEATLVPSDPIVGSATGVNWTWMQYLRGLHPRANIVRGHLLNHDLGGYGMPENLYPISTKANTEHSLEVEQKVKELLAIEINGKGRPVYYSVTVINNSHYPQDATFHCEFYTKGENNHKTKDIVSSLDHQGGFGGLHDNPLEKTKWYHGQRRGFEKGKEPQKNTAKASKKKTEQDKVFSSLEDHRTKKNIVTDRSTVYNVLPNADAAYIEGAGAEELNMDLIFSTLKTDYFNNWDGDVKKWIAYESGNEDGNFEKGILDLVYQSASYRDNIGDGASLKELVVQVVADQFKKALTKGMLTEKGEKLRTYQARTEEILKAIEKEKEKSKQPTKSRLRQHVIDQQSDYKRL